MFMSLCVFCCLKHLVNVLFNLINIFIFSFLSNSSAVCDNNKSCNVCVIKLFIKEFLSSCVVIDIPMGEVLMLLIQSVYSLSEKRSVEINIPVKAHTLLPSSSSILSHE